MDWITSSTVLDALADSRNQAAWGQFVSYFRAPIVNFATGTGLRTEEAEDVAQETLLAFARGYQNNQYDRSKGRLSKWLFGIAYRQVKYAFRKRQHTPGQINTATDGTTFWSSVPDEQTATVSWNETWGHAVLAHCLDQVKNEVQSTTFQAFELTTFGKLPPDDVAAELGMSKNAVVLAKHRVVKRLRELRKQYEELL
ncbi:MAG: RNA polymerase sigma factor [Planctomycetes bacterium]|nr:RNA polymerase sigma factor [Planctomycetota bacterium]